MTTSLFIISLLAGFSGGVVAWCLLDHWRDLRRQIRLEEARRRFSDFQGLSK